MCFGNKTARRQARAMEAQAAASAANDGFAAQAAAAAKSSASAMDQAAKQAAELLSAPAARAEVSLAEDVPEAEIDSETGRRKTTRSSFQVRRQTGINL